MTAADPVDPEEMTCQELVELLTDYLEGALDPSLERLVSTHVSICEPCGMYLDQLRAVIRIAGDVDSVEMPKDVLETLLTVFRGTGRA